MQRSAQRSDAKTERPSFPTLTRNLSWDDIRYFIACADFTSFRKAADNLGVSSSTVVRRIKSLEDSLKTPLFDRLPEGVVLTQAGIDLIDSARKMERSAFDIARRRSDTAPKERCSVTISITEGLGSYWVMPHLATFQKNTPQIVTNLFCSMTSADVLRLEADIAIQFIRPENPDLIVVKLGRLHIHTFAARQYLDDYGTPQNKTELMNHRLVEQIAAPPIIDGAMAAYFGLEDIRNIVGVRTNTSTAHLYAIEKGAGIGGLPTFAYALGAQVEPLDIGGPHSLEIWMTYHPDIKNIPQKAYVIKWLRSIFAAKTYPWFADDFIHPLELRKMMPANAGINMGKGFLSVKPW